MKNDLVFECGFFGRMPDSMGCMYLHPAVEGIEEKELYFAALYLCRMISLKKISYETATMIQDSLKKGKELQKVMEAAQTDSQVFGIRIREYNGFWKQSFSASMILNDKNPFRLGYIGFGMVFTDKRKLNFCAMESVNALLYTLYQNHKEDTAFLTRLWKVAEEAGNLKFDKNFNSKNYQSAADKIMMAASNN